MSAEKKTTTAVSKKDFDVTAYVMKKVDAFQKSGELKIPSDYSPENAIKSAQLILAEAKDRNGKPVLEVCTQTSIANALLKTVVWGLSPLKTQVYYIPYANKLECSISYTGNIALAKRYGNLSRIKANCIMEGDDFEFEIDSSTGRRRVVEHKQTLESIGSEKIKGVYAVYELNDGTLDVEIMNFSQVQKSWGQGATKGNSPAHKGFGDQMAIRTVINRACKLLIRASDDKVLYDEEDKNTDYAKENVKHDVDKNANGETIDIDSLEVDEENTSDQPSEEKEESKKVETEKAFS